MTTLVVGCVWHQVSAAGLKPSWTILYQIINNWRSLSLLLRLCVLYGLWGRAKIKSQGKLVLSHEREIHLYFNFNSLKLCLCSCFHPEVLATGILVFGLHPSKLPPLGETGRHSKFLLESSLRISWALLGKSQGSLSFCLSVKWLN